MKEHEAGGIDSVWKNYSEKIGGEELEKYNVVSKRGAYKGRGEAVGVEDGPESQDISSSNMG